MKMKWNLKTILITILVMKVRCKEPELPLCPTNFQFFPQNLPLHCRMPNDPKLSGPKIPMPMPMPPFPPPFLQAPSADGQPNPMPFPLPPGMPGPGPFPMPMPVPAPGPAHKLPVIVMPFYSPDPSYKKPLIQHRHRDRESNTRKPASNEDSCSDTDFSGGTSKDTSSEGRSRRRSFRRSGKGVSRRHRRRHEHAHSRQDLLTPILQYVTKDGYVIFEKKITKTEAKDWLSMKKENNGEDREQTTERIDVRNDNFEVAEHDVNADVEILDVEKDKEPVKSEPLKKHHLRKPAKVHRPKEEDKTKENAP